MTPFPRGGQWEAWQLGSKVNDAECSILLQTVTVSFDLSQTRIAHLWL